MADWYFKFIILSLAAILVAVVVFSRWERYKILLVFFLIILFANTGFTYITQEGIPTSVAELLYFSILMVMVLAHVRGKSAVPDIGIRGPIRVYLLCSIVGIISAINFDVVWPHILMEIKSYLGYIFYLYLIPFLLNKKEDVNQCLWWFVIFSVIPFLHVIPNLKELAQIEHGRVDISVTWGALNVFVGYVLPLLFVAIALLSTSSGVVRKGFLSSIILVGLYSLFYSKTRSGWIAFCFSLFLFFSLSGKRMKMIVASGILVLLVVLSGQMREIESIIESRMVGETLEYQDTSLQKRLWSWEIAKKTFEAHPLFGSGWGGYLIPLADGRLSDTSIRVLPRWHNSFYEILSQLGLFGVFSFYWLWFRVGKISLTAWKKVRRSKEGVMLAGLFSAVIAAFIYSFGEQQFYRIETASVSWFMTGLLLFYAQKVKAELAAVESAKATN